jgi:hypothetical protein
VRVGLPVEGKVVDTRRSRSIRRSAACCRSVSLPSWCSSSAHGAGQCRAWWLTCWSGLPGGAASHRSRGRTRRTAMTPRSLEDDIPPAACSTTGGSVRLATAAR